jgi:murein DD-endopeptidase MepM/ murein hydrolase activator NlpD
MRMRNNPSGRRWSRRRLLAVLAAAPLAPLLARCGENSEGEPPVSITSAPTEVPTEVATAEPTATATPEVDTSDLHGFAWPIEGACMPSSDNLLPNAPRAYRNGVHEGIDFYNGYSCASVTLGTPVYAMAAGVVIRADIDYVDLTPEEVLELDATTTAQGYSDPETLDLYRGRQVWIDHGGGVVTRYCHLLSIVEDVFEGTEVEQGQLIAAVGESGTPESVTAPGTEYHLHAEVRIGDSFLGADLPLAEVRALYERLFEPADS